MQSASILQQTLSQVGMKVHFQTDINSLGSAHDYVIINFSPAHAIEYNDAEQEVLAALQSSSNVIVGLPSSALAIADKLMKLHPVKCITKPLARRKLTQTLLSFHPLEQMFETEATVVEESEKMPLTIMAVDDNPANLKLITALLQERVTRVVSCSNGQEAVDRANEEQFDIILMDIQMPHMDGVTASQNIKGSTLNAKTPVIAVTAHAMAGERDRLLKAGMDDYLTKPIEEHVLQQVLVHWSPLPHPYHVEKLTLSDQVEPPIEIEAAPHLVIDWPMALKQAANKADLAQEMLGMLLSTLPEIVTLSNQAVDGELSSEQLLHHIHKLHGSCTYSGVPRLRKICATLEQALRSGQSIEDVEPEIYELQDEVEKVIQEGKRFTQQS